MSIYKSPISAIMIGLIVERELFLDSAKVQEEESMFSFMNPWKEQTGEKGIKDYHCRLW